MFYICVGFGFLDLPSYLKTPEKLTTKCPLCRIGNNLAFFVIKRYTIFMRQFDPIVKHILARFSNEFALLHFDESGLEVLESLDTQQSLVKVHQTI